ncbi:hypothetical protein ACOSP7_018859 [Xanthoceras sorbifolium]
MLAQVGHGKDYKKKYLNIDAGKEPKEKYNLYGFVWALQDVVHERLEPSDIELTQSHYEGLMDITDLFPQNTMNMQHDISIGDACVDSGQNTTAPKSMHSVPPSS